MEVGLEEHLEQTGMTYLPHPCPGAKQDGLQGVHGAPKYSGVVVVPSGRAFLRKKTCNSEGKKTQTQSWCGSARNCSHFDGS